MKKILIFLYFLLPIILFSQENQLENDSTIISEYLDSLNSFKESGDPLSLDNLYSDLSGLTSGNRYLNPEEWKGKLGRLLSVHFAALSAIADTLDFSFYPDSLIRHRRIYPPCEVIIDSILYSDIGNFSPDLIVDDSCRLAYIQK